MEVQPVERVQPTGQINDSLPFRLQFNAFHKEISGSEQEQAKDVEKAVRTLNKAAADYDIALQFSRDDETGTIVIKMVKQGTGEVIHQIPDEAMLHLSAVLGKLQGQLFARTA
jgi:uncharacterized FlaG/YvyC family protein